MANLTSDTQLVNVLRDTLEPLVPVPLQGTPVFGIPYTPENIHRIRILTKMTIEIIRLLQINDVMQEHMLFYLCDTKLRPEIIVNEDMIHEFLLHLYVHLQLPMGRLPIFGEPHGMIIGGGQNFFLRHGNVTWDITDFTIMPNIQSVKEWGPFQTNAKFVIISESKGFLRWLIGRGIFTLFGPAILATGSGISDYSTRLLLAKLSREGLSTNEHRQIVPLPVFLFVDPDEAGVRLAMNYLQGSQTLAQLPGGFPGENYQNKDGNYYFKLPPRTRYLGVSSQDLIDHGQGRLMTDQEFASMQSLQSSLPSPSTGQPDDIHHDIRTMISDFIANRRVGRLASIIDEEKTNPDFILNKYLRAKNPVMFHP